MTFVPIKAKYLRAFIFRDSETSLQGLADRLEFYKDATQREYLFIGTLTHKLKEANLI
jgi:hypothetical protein